MKNINKFQSSVIINELRDYLFNQFLFVVAFFSIRLQLFHP